jgi:hypothetical protein
LFLKNQAVGALILLTLRWCVDVLMIVLLCWWHCV